jgi:dimethylhistidine N-methyltransferase
MRSHPVLSAVPRISPQPASEDERWVDRLSHDPQLERRTLVANLLATPASIEPKYFYDALGCALFGAICELPEYYPTRTERAIFDANRLEIAAVLGRGKTLVDLGAGDCAKAAGWIPWLTPECYVAVDISTDAAAPALDRLAAAFPDIEMRGVITDFSRGLELRRELGDGPLTFFFPGSSIGNFSRDFAQSLLADVARHCRGHAGSGLMIGVDTPKAAERLVAAYSDTLGVTAAFNRNILNHVNHVLGTDFLAEGFEHVARYDAAHQRIEMYLRSTRAQTVRIDGIARLFDEDEKIHTENSHKFEPAVFTAMLERAGFHHVRVWQDAARDFAVYCAT